MTVDPATRGLISESANKPLIGIRVLDLTQFLSGPYCTQILSDLGADVVKVEPPEGDLTRQIPPHFVGNDSVYFLALNRGKKSVTVDLKTADGQRLVRDMVHAHDIVVENFRPGVLARLGISSEALRKKKPSLIWCSISGFGQDGPYRDKPAYDMIVQAMSGGMSLTGEEGGTAVRAGIPIGDICAGMYGAIGILAALNRRNSTGLGDYIDISMLDCQAAMLSYQAAYHLHSGETPKRQGAGHDSIPTYRAFPASDDREVVVTANTERMWQGLCRALDLADLVDNPEFGTNKARFANRHKLWPILCDAFRGKSAAEWVTLLEKEQVPAAVVNDISQAVQDAQIRHRNMVATLRGKENTVRVMGDPIVLASSDRVSFGFPPGLGQDTVSVLTQTLGLEQDRIDDLINRGVISSTRSRIDHRGGRKVGNKK
jgi:crotonobetainyl-CoA:carnitine CoA-transferase CaiB-like acyl-CoA transferase